MNCDLVFIEVSEDARNNISPSLILRNIDS